MPLDENRLRADAVYESRAPIASLITDLNQIQTLASGWHAARKRLALWDTVAWTAGIISFAIGLWYIGLLLFALGSGVLYWRQRYPKAVANHAERCAFGKSIAAMLQSDADLRTPVTMRVAFDPRQETLSEGTVPDRKNGKERLYKVSWFSVQAGLHDGTVFTQTVDDLVRERSFTNARGKSKTKSRTQNLIVMRFDYPAEIYGDLTQFREKMQAEIQLPPVASVRGLEITGRAVKVKAVVTGADMPGSARSAGARSLLVQSSSMLALGVYRMLNLSREIEERKRAQAKIGGGQ